MRNTHCRILKMARKMTNEENEKSTWQDLKYGERHCKMWKMGELEYGKKTEKRGKV